MEKYYRILDLEPGASQEEVRQAYLLQSMVWHPDRLANNPKVLAKAQERMQKINEAYDRLKDYKPDSSAAPNSEAPPKSRPNPARESPPPEPQREQRPPRGEERSRQARTTSSPKEGILIRPKFFRVNDGRDVVFDIYDGVIGRAVDVAKIDVALNGKKLCTCNVGEGFYLRIIAPLGTYDLAISRGGLFKNAKDVATRRLVFDLAGEWGVRVAFAGPNFTIEKPSRFRDRIR